LGAVRLGRRWTLCSNERRCEVTETDVETIPVLPENSEVLGYPSRCSHGYWPHLRFPEAEPMQDSTMLMALTGKVVLGRDVHLNVPFEDDEPDRHAPKEDLPWYRVRPVQRPGFRCIAAELRDGAWHWVFARESQS